MGILYTRLQRNKVFMLGLIETAGLIIIDRNTKKRE